tara:strand:+ start:1938 stop:4283 length:2346 start_codon:yes stop_codon:yes gene_type:complete
MNSFYSELIENRPGPFFHQICSSPPVFGCLKSNDLLSQVPELDWPAMYSFFKNESNNDLPDFPIESLENLEIMEIEDALGQLSSFELYILFCRSMLNPNGVSTLEEIGQDFNVTRERVRQLEKKAIAVFEKTIQSSQILDLYFDYLYAQFSGTALKMVSLWNESLQQTDFVLNQQLQNLEYLLVSKNLILFHGNPPTGTSNRLQGLKLLGNFELPEQSEEDYQRKGLHLGKKRYLMYHLEQSIGALLISSLFTRETDIAGVVRNTIEEHSLLRIMYDGKFVQHISQGLLIYLTEFDRTGSTDAFRDFLFNNLLEQLSLLDDSEIALLLGRYGIKNNTSLNPSTTITIESPTINKNHERTVDWYWFKSPYMQKSLFEQYATVLAKLHTYQTAHPKCAPLRTIISFSRTSSSYKKSSANLRSENSLAEKVAQLLITLPINDRIKSFDCLKHEVPKEDIVGFVLDNLVQTKDLLPLKNSDLYFVTKGTTTGLSNGYGSAIRKFASIQNGFPIEALIQGMEHSRGKRGKTSSADSLRLLDSDQLGAILDAYFDEVSYQDGTVYFDGPLNSDEELNPSEIPLVNAFLANDGLLTLEELVQKVPDVGVHGSTIMQALYGQSPLFEKPLPELFHLRGWPTKDYDSKLKVYLEQIKQSGHAWLERGGWLIDTNNANKVTLKLSKTKISNEIKIPIKLEEFFPLQDASEQPLHFVFPQSGGRATVLLLQKPEGFIIRNVSSIHSVASVLPGDTLSFTKISFNEYEVEVLSDVQFFDKLVINLGNMVSIDL